MCEGVGGGTVRLGTTEKPVDLDDLDQYFKLLDVFFSDGFLDSNEKETLRGPRQNIYFTIDVISLSQKAP